MSTERCLRKTKPSVHNEGQDRKIRNSTNQRNFRSRRKTYVLELEQKVEEFERAGVTATRQLQEAARTVAAENAVLRSLTTAGMGWTEQELDHYISRKLGRIQSSFLSDHHGNRNHCGCKDGEAQQFPTNNTDQRRLLTLPQHLPPLDNSPTQTREHENTFSRSEERLALPSCDNNVDSEDLLVASPTAHGNGNVVQSASDQEMTTGATQSDHTTLEENRNHSQSNEKISTGNSMSCEQAAAVLSGLRAQESLEVIRETLGCISSSTCNVTHWELFQRMDDTIS